MSGREAADAILTIDLGAVAENYRRLRERFTGAELGAVVKADAYGLGVAEVAGVLWAAGCRTFFVATFDEGLGLRTLQPGARIVILNGIPAGAAAEMAAARLTPALFDLDQVQTWQRQCAHAPQAHREAFLNLDTGMNRLGMSASASRTIADEPARLDGITIVGVMSHLACADTPAHALNDVQRQAFAAASTALRTAIGTAPRSLVNSSGVFLDPPYHFDLGRPGAALYGVNPTPERSNPMAGVVRLDARILQVRQIDTPETVGYGATHLAARRSRIATVPVGYADGYSRALGNRAMAYIGTVRVPVVGRVSMDMITLDVSATPNARAGTRVELIGPHCPLDELAAAGGTIGYEILTRLGRRYVRRYIGEARA